MVQLTDKPTYMYILGGLIENSLRLAEYNDITASDFNIKEARIIFSAIDGLNNSGYSSLTIKMVDDYAQTMLPTAASTYYVQHNVIDYLRDCCEFGQGQTDSDFRLRYERLKKCALIRELRAGGYKVDRFYKDENESLTAKEDDDITAAFEAATVADIVGYAEEGVSTIRAKYLTSGGMSTRASSGAKELIESLIQAPNMGPDISGGILNAVTRGARPGCFYLKSAGSGTGKTRTSVFDACKLAYPVRYEKDDTTGEYKLYEETVLNENGDEVRRDPIKVLFIVTEMDKEEIQTIMIAYLSKVNEAHINMGQYLAGEYERVQEAIKIMDTYSDYFLIETIGDPNLVNVSATIKKYAIVDKVKMVFFDYIHSTSSLISQFSASKIREDVALMLLSNQMKQLAHDYGLFICSATQVSGEGIANTSGMIEFRNEANIRGSKAIADKCDVGYVMTKLTEAQAKEYFARIHGYIGQVKLSQESDLYPNFVFDVYKNRRGEYKNVRIWVHMDLGTGERRDLCMTDVNGDGSSFQNITKLSIYEKREVKC